MISTKRTRAITKFDLTSRPLKRVVDDIHDGRVELPFSLGSWYWREEDVRKLIVSIAEGDPIGVFTLADGTSIEHQPLVGEAKAKQLGVSVQLVLDGQQRLTAIYQAFGTPAPVQMDASPQPEHWLYFFNMKKAVIETTPLEDAIISVATTANGTPTSRSELHFIESEFQYEHGFFPTKLMLDFKSYRRGYGAFWDAETSDRRTQALCILDDFYDCIAASFASYLLPIITLNRHVSTRELLRIFEKCNTGLRTDVAAEPVAVRVTGDRNARRANLGGQLPLGQARC